MKYPCIHHADRPGVVSVDGVLYCWECYLPDGPLKAERCRQYQPPAEDRRRIGTVRRTRPKKTMRRINP